MSVKYAAYLHYLLALMDEMQMNNDSEGVSKAVHQCYAYMDALHDPGPGLSDAPAQGALPLFMKTC